MLRLCNCATQEDGYRTHKRRGTSWGLANPLKATHSCAAVDTLSKPEAPNNLTISQAHTRANPTKTPGLPVIQVSSRLYC
eukprot:scaffold44204_cov41-Cyclotella_meneghiniana.AAC.2